MRKDIEKAAEYLQENADLRAAVGLDADAVLEPHYLGVGEHNLNYWFTHPQTGRKLVLRVNVSSQPFHDDQAGYEFAALQALEPSGRTPEAIYLDNSADALGKGVMLIGFCEGAELDFDHLRSGDLRCAAQIMADVHAVPVGNHCRLHRPRDPLRELFDECVERFEVYRKSTFEDLRVTKWARSFIRLAERCLDTKPAAGDCSHVINTEPLPSHFLIPRHAATEAAEALGGAHARGRFCENPGSFIDWERPIIGEVAQDVAYFISPTTTFWDSEFLFPSDRVDAFVNDYWRAVDGRFERGNFEERFRAYRIMTVLRSVTWCCRALIHYGRGSRAHQTGKTAEKLPVYLSDHFMQMLADECRNLGS